MLEFRINEVMHVIVFSHLRWDFVYQRPQHLLSRCATTNHVWFMEEPIIVEPWQSARLEVSARGENLSILVPHLPSGLRESEGHILQRQLLDGFLAKRAISEFTLWYYTPMAIDFTKHLSARAVVYDCMDELSAFRGASPHLRSAEAELLRTADLMFTGGQSLYEAKKDKHNNVHALPSSIDVEHFCKARTMQEDPDDQRFLQRPRIGYAGVIDERLDVELLAKVAELRPEWHWVMLGPVVKIAEADLPRAANIHYLGKKTYQQLPAYLSGWDVGMLPFARNEATRYISPTKTPEYLAAGLPVISTSIRDVVRPYGERSLVTIADNASAFIIGCEELLKAKNDEQRLRRTDAFLAQNSWDLTWSRMRVLLQAALEKRVRTNARPVITTNADRLKVA